MLKNKYIFILLSVFILSIFLISNVSCASSVVLDGKSYDIPDGIEKLVTNIGDDGYIIFKNLTTNEFYVVYCPDFETKDAYFSIDKNGNEYIVYYTNSENWHRAYYGHYDTSSSKWVYDGYWGGSAYDGKTYSNVIFLTSTHTVYKYGSSDIFFQIPQTTKLGEIVEKAEMKETLTQIILILPLILVVVVSLIGFRKAWALLSKILHRA